MKKICKYCGKEYEYEKSQKNWINENYKITYSPKNFCCFECGHNFRKQNINNTCLEKYGSLYPSQSKGWGDKRRNTFQKKYGSIYYNNPKKKKQTNLEKYGKEYYSQTEEYKNKYKQTCLKKYGVDNPNKVQKTKDKIKQTNIEKYGVEYIWQIEEIKEKRANTIKEKYGVDYYSQTEEYHTKQYNTKKKNNSFNISKTENIIYQKLLEKYINTTNQYRSELYPFDCDFYIPELDLYIEYNGNWTHGFKPYNPEDKECIELVNKWKEKANEINFKGNTKNYYLNAIETWTIRDLLKRQTAKDNNLNWIEFFNMEEFMRWYNKL